MRQAALTRRGVAALLMVTLLGIGGWFYVRHSPACNEWRGKILREFQTVDAMGPGRTLAYDAIQNRHEASRPTGCPRLATEV